MAQSTKSISKKQYDAKVKEMKKLLRDTQNGTARMRANNWLMDNDYTTFDQKTFDSIMNDLQPKTKTRRKPVAKKKETTPTATKKKTSRSRKPVKPTNAPTKPTREPAKKSSKTVSKKANTKKATSKKSAPVRKEYPREVDYIKYNGIKIKVGDPIAMKGQFGTGSVSSIGKGKTTEIDCTITKIEMVQSHFARIWTDLPKKFHHIYSPYIYTIDGELTIDIDTPKRSTKDVKKSSKTKSAKSTSKRTPVRKAASSKAKTSSKKSTTRKPARKNRRKS